MCGAAGSCGQQLCVRAEMEMNGVHMGLGGPLSIMMFNKCRVLHLDNPSYVYGVGDGWSCGCPIPGVPEAMDGL